MTTKPLFSQRKGLKSPPKMQKDGMSSDLRTSIWNCYIIYIFNHFKRQKTYDGLRWITRELLFRFFKKPVNYIDYKSGTEMIDMLTSDYSELTWERVYDLIEVTLDILSTGTLSNRLTDALNKVFEEEFSPYRIINGIVSDITSEQEIEMLNEALANTDFPAITAHLNRALELLSDRQKPDYRNSIKESISAVESMAQHITGDPNTTLGNALKILEKKHDLHPSLKDGFLKLYGYTNRENGIRHAIFDEEPNLTNQDAKFFLLSCTSFINYLKSKL